MTIDLPGRSCSRESIRAKALSVFGSIWASAALQMPLSSWRLKMRQQTGTAWPTRSAGGKFGANIPKDFKAKARQMRFLQYRGFEQDHVQAAFQRRITLNTGVPNPVH